MNPVPELSRPKQMKGTAFPKVAVILSFLLWISTAGCSQAELTERAVSPVPKMTPTETAQPRVTIAISEPTPAPPETAQPRPPRTLWRLSAPENLVATTPHANLHIHDVVLTPQHITLVYSIDLLNDESNGSEGFLSPDSTLVGSGGAVHKATAAQRLAAYGSTTLASITFEPYKAGNRELYLRSPALIISDTDSSQTSQITGPIQLQILTRVGPDDSSNSITRLSGLRYSISGVTTAGIPGSFVGSSPRGQVATVGYKVYGVEKWFLVEQDGRVEELSEDDSADILGFLGITAPTPAGGRPAEAKQTGDEQATSTKASPTTGKQQPSEAVDPTATPSPMLPGSVTPEPASEAYRLDLGPGMVVAFVEGLTPGMSEKLAYVTHVPSGTQAILNREGQVIHRHDGRADGPGRLDALLEDRTAMARIIEGLTNGEDLRPREQMISWIPMMHFSGIHFLRRGWNADGQGGRDLGVEDLGSELYRIAFRGDGYAGAFHHWQDGDSTYLNPGTPVYAFTGYSSRFRLGTLEWGRVFLYEADTNPSAKTGQDLLDIQGKVTTIDILSKRDGETVLGAIDEGHAVERLVDMILESPVDQGSTDHDRPRYYLGIRLADGTSVVRPYWLETGELSRGIMTDPIVTLSVWQALPKEHLPAAPDGGPRISERLAARLGLAHLSFSGPELLVTGKPHSPTTRLMRRGEFTAMQGSWAGRTVPDPLVWVVQAQGSWRSAGIVPEEARRDFSVGLVAIDADTGATYSRSHRNEPLLGSKDTP